MPVALPPPDEATYQSHIIELLHALGYKVAHFRPAKTSKGWRTPAGADGKGWPDLVAVHDAYGIVFIEVKSATGKLTREQKLWRDWLVAAGQRWYMWTAGRDDLASIATTLRSRNALL